MSDLLAHLVDAPLANILILAGLAFLGIAVIGKISGKIEPSNSGRVMAGILGLGLLIYGIYSHSNADIARAKTKPSPEKQASDGQGQPSRPPQEPSPKGPFAGNWKNNNPNTRGVTRIEIQQEGSVVQVHAWGACLPKDCDWGTDPGTITAGVAHVEWQAGLIQRNMTLTPDAGRLLMLLDNVYKDNRPTRQEKEFFVRE